MILLPIDQYKGEIAALSAAFLWAATSVVFVLLGRRIPPLLLNFSKGVVAIALISLTLLITRQPFPSLPLMPISILFVSGVIGIGLGDTAYFSALNSLGARRTLLIETLAPPLAAILALIFLGESLDLLAWCGILLTLLGVAWVISERTPTTVVNTPHPLRGIIWGCLAAMAQAIGAVLSRFALIQSDITPLWSTLIRLIAGTVVVSFLLLIRSQTSDKHDQISWSFRLIGIIILTAFGSTFLGIWLQQMSLKFAPTGIAQTLTSTSPLFVLPFAAGMGDKISFRALVGVLIALAGIGVLFA